MRIQAHKAIEPKKPKCVRGNGASPQRRRAREALRDLDFEIRRARDRQRDAERALDRLL